jgi:hypothetical protein
MTPQEQLDILIAVAVEYDHRPSVKDLFRLRELLPDSAPYFHPFCVARPIVEEDEPE